MAHPFNRDIHLEKSFLDLREKHNIKHVIETGTFHGFTTQWLAENFENVYTIESNLKYLKIAEKNWEAGVERRIGGIKSYQGDSSKDLLHIIKEVPAEETLLIFLDAHWYANPVLKELDQIKESGRKPILAIHDFKVPDHPELGYDKYPDQGIVYEWSWVEDKIRAIYGENFKHYYNSEATGAMRGCLFIESL